MMPKEAFLLIPAVFAAAGLLMAQTAAPGDAPATAAIPEQEIGLSPGTAFDDPTPEPVREVMADPGDGAPLPRAFPGAPPMVTHLVSDYLPITREENLCVDCHLVASAGEGEPTPIPASHKTDLRRSPEKVGEGVVGARWVCVTCHVRRTGAGPLVDNRFAAGGAP